MSPERLIGKVFGVHPSAVTDETSNRTLEAWDSLGHVTLVTELEASYGVAISAEDALALTDVGTIKRFLSERGVRW